MSAVGNQVSNILQIISFLDKPMKNIVSHLTSKSQYVLFSARIKKYSLIHHSHPRLLADIDIKLRVKEGFCVTIVY